MKDISIKIDFKSPDGQFRTMNFNIHKTHHQKLSLGGFKDTSKMTIFQNAFSQTDQILKVTKQLFERETQIFDITTKSINPNREFGSQTLKTTHLFDNNKDDKILQPKKYFNSDLWLQRRIEGAMYIQKIMRGFLARKRMKKIKMITSQISDEKENITRQASQKEEQFKTQQIAKRTCPKVFLKRQNRILKVYTFN